ncbi:type II toxin-antitoxin system VapC family toxin [Mucilaginibacter sp.]|uniref:type II toxin-antitoxin system VapC family toxin n=1 Tax=Mucilaginibacter sp. TaxID=1882438 RepID=UPI00260AFF08|nr:type II toxin-antitoxin system VapC family toxin [Mucilaginibacter sp.]
MSFVLCDTNIFISLFRNIQQTVEELEIIGSENVLIPSISVMELYRGMQYKKEMAEMQKKITQYNILHYNEEVSRNAIWLINKFKLSHNLQIPDAIIGAMSIVYNIELFTYNLKDFKFIPGIKLYT